MLYHKGLKMSQIQKLLAIVALVFFISLTTVPLSSASNSSEVVQDVDKELEAYDVAVTEGIIHEPTGYSTERWHDFFWRIANFVVYVFILYILLRKPVSKYFSGRQENIARTLEYLETQSRNLDEQTKVMSRQLDQLSQERLNILSQYERDGAKERDRIISEAHQTAEVIIQRAEAAMDLEVKTARQSLTAEVGELAKNLAQTELIEKITDDDRSRLVLEFVDKVVKLPARK
jgi:F-type H+-transporting ATPase subunit b